MTRFWQAIIMTRRNKRMKNSGSSREIRNEKEEEESGGEDRISSLPDPLLIHILSFLGDTKETVKTCVLSKRWEFVWTDMLEINLGEVRSAKKIGRIIGMCNSLNKFSVKFPYIDRLASTVNHWLYYAIRNKVNDITLEFSKKYFDQYNVPQMLYSYSSLSKLSVSNCVIAPPLGGSIAWRSLESLTIGHVKLLDSVMEKILSNCPVLRSLHLKKCSGLKYLNIQSPNLTTLHYYGSKYGCNVPDISAPYLHVLLIYSSFWARQFKLINASSVVQVTIDIYKGYSYDWIATMNHMKEFLQSGLPSVEILELGPEFLKIVSLLDFMSWKLSSYANLWSWKLSSYTNLWSLTLKVYNHEMSIRGILAILRSSPNLRTLRIELTGTSLSLIEELDKHEIHVKDCKLDLVASHLKTVEIDKFRDAEDMEIDEFTDAEHMLTLVQILFKSAKVLEKMVIRFKDTSSSTSTDSMKIAARLLTFPRASPESVVVLHY